MENKIDIDKDKLIKHIIRWLNDNIDSPPMGSIGVSTDSADLKEKKEDLVKRKCFACSREKAMGKFERYCSDSCRTRATRYYQAPNSISW